MAKKKSTDILQEESFESSFKRLEEILYRLENETESTSLEQVLSFYQEGLQLVKSCRTRLNEAELKIEKINLEQQGSD